MEKYVDLLHEIYQDFLDGSRGKSGIIVFEKSGDGHEIIECNRIPFIYTERTIYECVIPWKIHKQDEYDYLPNVVDMIYGSYNTVAFDGLVPFKAILCKDGLFCIKSLIHDGPLKDFEYFSRNSGRSRSASRDILGRGTLPVDLIISTSYSITTAALQMNQMYGRLTDYWCTNLLGKYYDIYTYMINYPDNLSEGIKIVKELAFSHGIGIRYESWTEEP